MCPFALCDVLEVLAPIAMPAIAEPPDGDVLPEAVADATATG
jgi:hypothetical protein